MSEPLRQFDVVCDLAGNVGVIEHIYPSGIRVRQNIAGGSTYQNPESLIGLQGSWGDLWVLQNQLLLTVGGEVKTGNDNERAHRKLPFADECLAGMIVAFDGGDMKTFRALFNEAMNERFEAGIEYAKDNVSEWHREE